MDRFFTKTFFKFVFAFLIIIAVAFGVLIVVSEHLPPTTNSSQHNLNQVAQPNQ